MQNTRQMPWKGEKDPYKIWISEIILQQTRVQQGTDYYNRFIAAFPSVRDLANADESAIYKHWEGLGYYSRCKNLIATARFIEKELEGNFPENYEAILALKGIGPYTAAAIASFAFNLPFAVLDGNVFRILSRFFGLHMATDTTEGKKFYKVLAEQLLDKREPAAYNQAIMDFGAVICKPKQPLCFSCILVIKCEAYRTNQVAALPVSTKALVRKDRFFNYFLLEYQDSFYLRKRSDKDIWQNLYQFVLLETDSWLSEDELSVNEQLAKIFDLAACRIMSVSKKMCQKLTHQTIIGRVVHLKTAHPLSISGYERIERTGLKKLAFPRMLARYLEDKNVSLGLFSEEKLVICGESTK